MAPAEKPTQSWSSIDLACTRCRERKIRCGRERPRCSNCRHDGAECGYQSPGKRVNHIKVLCNNFDGLENRLINMEGQLSRLTTSLEKDIGRKNTIRASTEDVSPASVIAVDDHLTDPLNPTSPPADRHICRNQGDMVDRYHGPCSLVALCNSFRTLTLATHDTPGLSTSSTEESVAQHNALEDLLNRICYAAGTEEAFPQQTDHGLTRLPPKQFLLVAQAQFFQQVDYATDIFVQTHFCANVERVYNGPVSPSDEAWAVCFKTVVLLVLGTEISAQGNHPLFGGFARSFLLPSCTALVNSRLLTTPRLINVQTLILLSIVAQHFDPPGSAELIFAQACMLARTMGLHQTQTAPKGVSGEEEAERAKVFRALYLRDKSICSSRGSISWLPGYDCNIAPLLGVSADQLSGHADRIRLATLQDEIYRLSHSAESQRRSPSKLRNELNRIEQGLERWASTYNVFEPAGFSNRRALLQLDFMATRISALDSNPEPKHARLIRSDARASCLLLLIAHGNYDSPTIGRFNALTTGKDSSTSLEEDQNRYSRVGQAANRDSLPRPSANAPGETTPQPFLSLLDAFSVPAFFLLVKNILWPTDTDDDPQADADLDLLQKVCACYTENASRMQANNYSRKVGWTFESLLKVVELIRSGQQPGPASPPIEHHSSTSAHVSPPTQPMDLFSGSQSLIDFDLPCLSGWPTPPSSTNMAWDSWSAKQALFGAFDMAGTGDSAATPTFRESNFIPQTFDPRLSANLQQLPTSPPDTSSRKRPRSRHEPETFADNYPKPTLLSEFLAASPEMSFTLNA